MLSLGPHSRLTSSDSLGREHQHLSLFFLLVIFKFYFQYS